MSKSLHIPRGETGVIRIFAINRPVTEMGALIREKGAEGAAQALLQNDTVNPATIELFPISDLEGVGLPGYLIDGYAVDEAQIGPDRVRLDALDGYVMIVFSDSFDGRETTLQIGPDLTFISSYTEFLPDMKQSAIPTESALPYSGAPGMVPPTPARGPAGSVMVVMGLIVAIGLGLWWLLT